MSAMSWFEERFIESQTRLRYDCVSCGRAMWFPKSKHGKYVTCGGDCSKNMHDKHKNERAKNCQTCGSLFVPRISQLKNGVGKFCSQACNLAGREALNRDEIKKKAQNNKKEMFKNGLIVFPSGENHHSWKGGKDVSYPKRLKYVAEYKKKNKDMVRIWNVNRRKRNVGKLPLNLINKLKALQKNKCPVCKTSLANGFHVDHVVPLSTGGLNVESNIQLLCVKCNLNKSAKDPIKFMQERGFLL